MRRYLAVMMLMVAGGASAGDALLFGDGHRGALVVSGPVVVNRCTGLSGGVDAGALSVAVLSSVGLAAGDLVMLLETTGPIAAHDGGWAAYAGSGAPARPIPVTSSAGRFELLRIASVSSTIGFTAPLPQSFSASAQLILVPEYTTVTVLAGALSPPPRGTARSVACWLFWRRATWSTTVRFTRTAWVFAGAGRCLVRGARRGAPQTKSPRRSGACVASRRSP